MAGEPIDMRQMHTLQAIAGRRGGGGGGNLGGGGGGRMSCTI